jgi:hypothetical protein
MLSRSCRAVVCKAQKAEIGQAAAAAVLATTLMAGVSSLPYNAWPAGSHPSSDGCRDQALY